MIISMSISSDIALWMVQGHAYDKSTLVQVMA